MKVHDIVVYFDEQFGHNRFWKIISVCLGGTKQEGLIELQSLSETPGIDTEGNYHKTTLVPEVLLRNMKIYTPC